ncbi:MAG: DUF177 domain-containing protein [Acidobacteria bacterium]|nr:DUF177 domain-containing protein [Acidobacteriota bacterium]
MVIDLTTLAADRTPIVQQIAPTALDVPAEDFAVAGPTRFSGEIERLGAGAYHLRGHLEAPLSLTCARCVEPFDLAVDTHLDLRFVPAAVEKARTASASAVSDDEDGRQMDDADPSLVTYDEPAIDLAQVVREQLYLALPMKPLCRPDCQGLCPRCGTNRNLATCTCEDQWEDPRLAGLKSLLKDADGQAPRE